MPIFVPKQALNIYSKYIQNYEYWFNINHNFSYL